MTKKEYLDFQKNTAFKIKMIMDISYEDLLFRKDVAKKSLASGDSIPVALKRGLGSATNELRVVLLTFPDFKEQYDKAIALNKQKSKRRGIYFN